MSTSTETCSRLTSKVDYPVTDLSRSNRLVRFARHGAVGAMAAQVSQAGGSFVLQLIAAVTLGLSGFGKFAILYGTIVLLTGIASGFVGDSLTVLNRRAATIRSALEGWALALSIGAGLIGGAIVIATRFVTVLEGALFAVATVLFLLEDVFRRILMAELRFWRIAIVDLAALIVAMSALVLASSFDPMSLSLLFGALALGQGVALLVAGALLPREERYLARLSFGGYSTVARYGVWRSAQQGMRPALLTAVRAAVVVAVGLTAIGQLESARLFVAPAMLLVSGFSTFLFATFAKNGHVALDALLKKADRGVLQLVAITVVIGGISLLILPTIGQLPIGKHLNTLMVIGWIAYSASVAAVTPYGALAAVRGRQATVLALRGADSFLSLAGACAVLAVGAPVSVVPFILTAGSLLGGLAIRWLVLHPEAALLHHPAPEAISFQQKKAVTHV